MKSLSLTAKLHAFAARAHNSLRQELHGRDSARPGGLRPAHALHLRDLDRCPHGSGDLIDHDRVVTHIARKIQILHRGDAGGAAGFLSGAELAGLKRKLLDECRSVHGVDVPSLFDSFDTNSDGKLVLAEVGGHLAEMLPGVASDAELGMLLADMDFDGSGAVTLLELAEWCGAAVAVALAGLGAASYDANGDGVLQAGEMTSLLEARLAASGHSGAQTQGDAAMYAPELLVARYKLRSHPAVLAQLARWWEASKRELDDDDGGTLDFGEYAALHGRLVRAFAEDDDEENDLTPEQERASLLEDWRSDNEKHAGDDDGGGGGGGGGSGGGGGGKGGGTAGAEECITQTELYDSIFALADAWTEGAEAAEYVDFLALLYAKVFGRFQRRVRRFLSLRHLQEHHDEAHPAGAGGARGFARRGAVGGAARGGTRQATAEEQAAASSLRSAPGPEEEEEEEEEEEDEGGHSGLSFADAYRYGGDVSLAKRRVPSRFVARRAPAAARRGGGSAAAAAATAAMAVATNQPMAPPEDPWRALARRRPLDEPLQRWRSYPVITDTEADGYRRPQAPWAGGRSEWTQVRHQTGREGGGGAATARAWRTARTRRGARPTRPLQAGEFVHREHSTVASHEEAAQRMALRRRPKTSGAEGARPALPLSNCARAGDVLCGWQQQRGFLRSVPQRPAGFGEAKQRARRRQAAATTIPLIAPPRHVFYEDT